MKTRRDKRNGHINKKVQGKIIKLQEHHLYKNRDKLQALLQKEEDYVTDTKYNKKTVNDEDNEQQDIDSGGLSPEERNDVQTLL